MNGSLSNIYNKKIKRATETRLAGTDQTSFKFQELKRNEILQNSHVYKSNIDFFGERNFLLFALTDTHTEREGW